MSKELSIVELANIVNGRIVNNLHEEIKITGTCAIDKYVPTKISFIRDAKYGKMLNELKEAIVLIPRSLVNLCEEYPQNTYIVVENVLNSIMDIQEFFYGSESTISEEGIHLTAKIGEGARFGTKVYIGENAYIGENVVIGDRTKIMHNSCILDNVAIGNNTYIYPAVCIYKNCQIGNDCVIHSGARVGVDGFRFEQDIEQKKVRKMYHVGRVVIGDRVEIGANCTIDRATFEDDVTILSDDVKLDDQVHIGHNAKVGARTLIAAQTCISGSVKISDDVWIGAGVTVSNGVTIGNRAKILLNAVVAYDVADDEIMSGFYAMPHRQWKQAYKKLKEGLSDK